MPSPDRKRGLAVAGAFVALLLIVWIARMGGVTNTPVIPEHDSVEAHEKTAVVEGQLKVLQSEPERRAAEIVPPAAAEGEGAPEETSDRSARGRLRVRVTDRFDTPIALATVTVTGFRDKATPGTGRGWRWGTPREETDTEGMAELDYPVWSRGNGQWLALSKVIFTVEHSDYMAARVEGAVENDEIHVVLEHGSVLIVSGWIDSAAERILDVDPLLSYAARVEREGWVPIRDGRLSCSRIPPGRHIVALRHDRDGVTYSSEGTEFELVEGDQKELHLRLLPPRTVRGSLDAQVPRPVEHGQVRAAVESGARERRAVLMQSFSTTVAPDGSIHASGRRGRSG